MKRVAFLALALASCERPSAAPVVRADSTPAEPSVRYDHAEFALESPIPAGTFDRGELTPKMATEGEKLFASMTCDGCHGLGGVGFIGPSIADGRYTYGNTDRAIYETIYYGRPNGMPGFGAVAPPEVIWRLVAYVKSLKPPVSSPTLSW
jgi:cytochrome c oxidase cbb3-type subunit III